MGGQLKATNFGKPTFAVGDGVNLYLLSVQDDHLLFVISTRRDYEINIYAASLSHVLCSRCRFRDMPHLFIRLKKNDAPSNESSNR